METTAELRAYLADDGETVNVGGTDVLALVDIASGVTLSDAVVQETSLQAVAADLPSVPDGTLVVLRGENYRVRQNLLEPPDGAFRRLILAKG